VNSHSPKDPQEVPFAPPESAHLARVDGKAPARLLAARTLVGRMPACDMTISETYVSREHAVLSWSTRGWEVKDLGSKNGTSVNARRIEPGRGVRLHLGSTLTFGDGREEWRLVSDSAPIPFAQGAQGEQVAADVDDVLSLPSPDHPEVVITDLVHGDWTAESSDRTWTVRDRDVVKAGGVNWHLRLPTALDPTVDRSVPVLTELEMVLRVSADEEYVEWSFTRRGENVTLPNRAHSYLVLTLARLRTSDPEGWIHRDELAAALNVDPTALSMQLVRARKQLARAGVHDAADLFESKSGSGMLRLRTDRVRVERL